MTTGKEADGGKGTGLEAGIVQLASRGSMDAGILAGGLRRGGEAILQGMRHVGLAGGREEARRIARETVARNQEEASRRREESERRREEESRCREEETKGRWSELGKSIDERVSLTEAYWKGLGASPSASEIRQEYFERHGDAYVDADGRIVSEIPEARHTSLQEALHTISEPEGRRMIRNATFSG